MKKIYIPESVTVFGDDTFRDDNNLTIYGVSGSYAQDYANSHSIPFVAGYEPGVNPTPIQEGWKQNSTGWWYQNADGTYVKSAWKKIGNYWYHFNASGYMQTGWQKIGSSWYYLGTNGSMRTGWQKIGSSWYYFSSSGEMAASRWISNKYYVKSNGAMAVNEWVDNGKYYVDGNGVWVPGKEKVKAGWKKNTTGWWYQNSDGSYPKNSWKKIGNYWYHFNASGYMQTGWLRQGTDWYYLASSGGMVANQWVLGEYYMKADGTMAREEWIGIYHVGPDGKWDATRGKR